MSVHYNSQQKKTKNFTQMELARMEREKRANQLAVREAARKRDIEAAKIARDSLDSLKSSKIKMVSIVHSDIVMLGLVQSQLKSMAANEGLDLHTYLRSGALVVAMVKAVA